MLLDNLRRRAARVLPQQGKARQNCEASSAAIVHDQACTWAAGARALLPKRHTQAQLPQHLRAAYLILDERRVAGDSMQQQGSNPDLRHRVDGQPGFYMAVIGVLCSLIFVSKRTLMRVSAILPSGLGTSSISVWSGISSRGMSCE